LSRVMRTRIRILIVFKMGSRNIGMVSRGRKRGSRKRMRCWSRRAMVKSTRDGMRRGFRWGNEI
jgi:hypothetical protein